MAIRIKNAVAAATVLLAAQAMAQGQITLYEASGFRGEAVTINGPVPNLSRYNFQNRTSAIIVERGRWEVCDAPGFEGRCALLRRGHYDDVRSFGLNNQISSVRPAGGQRRYEAEPPVSSAPLYEYRRRPQERIYQAPVNWSRAVMGPPSQRCWIERQAVQTPSGGNPGGAVAGAVIGGILGHQVGGGSGRDAATAAGVIAGAAIGNNMGGGGGSVVTTQDVQRCQTTHSGPPAYYEVSYTFRGAEHRVQMSTPPGATVTVNERGQPRM